MLFSSSWCLMPRQCPSPEKGSCEGNDLDLYLEGSLFASWSDIRLSGEVSVVRTSSKNTDLWQKFCDVVDLVVYDDPAISSMIMPRDLVQRDSGGVAAGLLLLRNARRRFAEA
jgi:hypothetical protein